MVYWQMPLGVWSIFLLTLAVAEIKPWGWYIWIPWLTVTTAIPIIVAIRRRLKDQRVKNEQRD